MRFRGLALVVLAGLLASCTITVVGTSTASGYVAGASFQAEHNHPALAYSIQECTDVYTGRPPSYSERVEPHTDALRPDPDWTVPEGRYADVPLDGFIFLCEPGA